MGKVALEVGGDPIVIEQGISDVEQKDETNFRAARAQDDVGALRLLRTIEHVGTASEHLGRRIERASVGTDWRVRMSAVGRWCASIATPNVSRWHRRDG